MSKKSLSTEASPNSAKPEPELLAKPANSKTDLGAGFNRLWATAISTNLADGLARTAASLIAVTLTDDPFLISVIPALSMLPWLLFAIIAGGVVDRYDRRSIIAVASFLRVMIGVLIVALIFLNQLTIWWIYLLVLIFGIAETFADNANNALVPQLVARAKLMKANARIQGAQVAVDNFIATPISGILFAVFASLPLIIAGFGYFLAGLLVLTIPLSVKQLQTKETQAAQVKEAQVQASTAKSMEAQTLKAQTVAAQTVEIKAAEVQLQEIPEEEPQESLQAEAVTTKQAFKFLFSNHYLLSMNILTCLTGFFFALAQSTFLLYVVKLGTPLALIGVVTSVVGVGALIGAVFANRVIERFGAGLAMLLSLGLAAITLIPIALFQNLYLVVGLFMFISLGVSIWNVAWGSLRQIVTPDHLQGRVFGISRTMIWGVQPLGSLIGGALGWFELWLPILVGGVACTLVTVFSARLILSSTKIAQNEL